MLYCLSHAVWSQSRMMKKSGRENKTAVVVGTITDDARIYEIPKLKVRFSFLIVCASLFALILLHEWVVYKEFKVFNFSNIVLRWQFGNGNTVLINEIIHHLAWLLLGWVTLCRWVNTWEYVTSNPARLSLAWPWVGSVSISENRE